MGDLPIARVTDYVQPFTISGIDGAGPIKIGKSRRRERAHISKAYIVLFFCFNIKAVHLKFVTDLTSELFLVALRCFTEGEIACNYTQITRLILQERQENW